MHNLRAELNRYNSDASKLASIKHNADRVIVAVLSNTKYDSKTDKFLTKYENLNVIIGKEDSAEQAKKEIESFLNEFKGTFKTVW